MDRSISRDTLAAGTRGVPILMYHSISREASPAFRPFAVAPEMFRAQAEALRRDGCRTLTVSGFVDLVDAGREVPPRTVVLTFDDGFLDFHADALPVLAEFGLVATQYVVSGLVGQTARWLASSGEGERALMSLPHLREAQAQGIEIGAHTRTHRAVDRLADPELGEEIAGSRKDLEDRLGTAVRSFAYPFGFYSDRARDAVIRAGYASACAVRYRTSSLADDRYALARHIVRGDTTLTQFSRAIRGHDPGLRTSLDRVRSGLLKLARGLAPATTTERRP